MSFQGALARVAGDTWRSWRMLALWPWPAVVVGVPHGKFTWDDYRAFTRHLLPGDMILTCSEPYFLSNRGIKGSFKHLAVYTGAVKGYRDDKSGFILKAKSLGVDYVHKGEAVPGTFERTVTHAISEGVVCQDLGELLFHADWACAVRVSLYDKVSQKIVDAALDQLGLEYNFDFKPTGPKKFYCTELGVFCVEKAGLQQPCKTKLTTNWKGMLLPFDRWKSNVCIADSFVKHFNVIVSSLSCNQKGFAQRSIWPDDIRVKLKSAPDARTGG